MKMKLIALSVAAAAMMPAVVGADTTLYGKAHLAVESEGAGESVIEVKSHASRVGLKGKEDLGNGLKAVYKFEWQLDMADKSKGSDDHIKSRNQYAGLSGGFGTVLFGRHDTPLKMSQESLICSVISMAISPDILPARLGQTTWWPGFHQSLAMQKSLPPTCLPKMRIMTRSYPLRQCTVASPCIWHWLTMPMMKLSA